MASANELEAVTEHGEALQTEIVSFLQEMVRANSENPPGDYGPIREVVASQYEEYGWDVETVWASEELLEEQGLEYPRPNILGYATRDDGPTIALNAHLDTVPVDESKWSFDPFSGEVRDGRVWGRGAKDSKGRIASYTLAARILEESNLVPEDVSIVLAMTADEETGGEAGARYVTDSGALRPDYAIVEGAGWNEIWHAASGVIRYRVSVSGEAAHAGTRPEQGSNALLGAAHVLLALETYAEELQEQNSRIAHVEYPTCVPATIEGGVKTNVVPPSCSFTVDTRVPPDHDIDKSEQNFRKVIDNVAMPDGTEVSVDILRKSGSYCFDPDEPQIKAIKQNADEILDIEVPVVGTRGSTDARHWAKNGAKCVNYGPGDEQSNSHAADERVVIDQVLNVGMILAAALLDIGRLQ